MPNDLEFARLDVLGKLDDLSAKLLQQDPMLPVHLSSIHRTLMQYEELVHLLSDEDIRKLITAQKKQINVELVKAITVRKTTKTPKTTVDDL